MILSPERKGRMTGSRVNVLMNGDEQDLLNLWRELRGDPEFEPEDLSDNFQVQLGSHTEPFHLDWHHRSTGNAVTRRGEFITHPVHDWAAVTIDGYVETLSAAIEVKHVGGYEEYESIRERYMPQCHWTMIVTNTTKCVFSVIMGNRNPIVEVIDYDTSYGSELWRRAYEFMECVWSGKCPVVLPPVSAPVRPIKTYDMTGNNAWAAYSDTWLKTKQAAKENAAAVKELKTAVPADAIRCFGHGITVNRNKAGALTIREGA